MQEMLETQIQSLGQNDHLEEEMTIHSSILAWKIPWTEEPGGLQSMGSQELDTTYQLNHHRETTKAKTEEMPCDFEQRKIQSQTFIVSNP